MVPINILDNLKFKIIALWVDSTVCLVYSYLFFLILNVIYKKCIMPIFIDGFFCYHDLFDKNVEN